MWVVRNWIGLRSVKHVNVETGFNSLFQNDVVVYAKMEQPLAIVAHESMQNY